MENKNAGLTLIELVAVIGIMAVLVGVMGLSVTAISSQRVSSAAGDVKEALQTAQTIAMSKRGCYVDITYDDGDVVFTTYAIETNLTGSPATEEIKAKVVSKLTIGGGIKVALAGDVGAQVESGSHYRLRFDRASGAYKTIGIAVGGSFVENSFDTEKIVFTKGSKTATLVVSRLTGRITYGD